MAGFLGINMVETLLLVALVVLALLIIGLVLLQQGKGADMGASFGAGASQTLFGSQGSGNFLTRTTWLLATGFFIVCLGLGYIAREKSEQVDVFDYGLGKAESGKAPGPGSDAQKPTLDGEVPVIEVETEQFEVPELSVGAEMPPGVRGVEAEAVGLVKEAEAVAGEAGVSVEAQPVSE